MNELSFTEGINLRDNCISHYEVLERVKNLLLIPGTEFATMKQVAEFYEVEVEVIKKITQRNSDELTLDGVHIEKKDYFLRGQLVPLENSQYKTVFSYDTDKTITITNRGLKVFPRRAILRIGMLLRDSAVTKEVRTQLLNIEERNTMRFRTATSQS